MPTAAKVVIVPQELGAPLRVDEVKLPDPGPYQVVVKQYASGVCHSQLHQIHRQRPTPVILGHESTGVVVAKGREVSHVKEGDELHAVVEPGGGVRLTPYDPAFEASMKAFERTRKKYRNALRELAK